MTSGQLALRPYTAADEDAAIALWQRSWQQAYPDIDFGARLVWWRERWRGELVPVPDPDPDPLAASVLASPSAPSAPPSPASRSNSSETTRSPARVGTDIRAGSRTTAVTW